jgi:UDP-N-acetylglucosamine 2-epimerase
LGDVLVEVVENSEFSRGMRQKAKEYGSVVAAEKIIEMLQ